MVLIDEADWPLVLVRWEYPTHQGDVDLYRSRFRYWLQRETRFAVFNVKALGESSIESVGRLHSPPWIQPMRGMIARQCAGVALLITDALANERSMRLLERETCRALGCPLRCFSESDDALLWLRDRLAAVAPETQARYGSARPQDIHQ